MNRIPTPFFYVSTISEGASTLNIADRNCYELMHNLLNGYFTALQNVTFIFVEDALKSLKISLVSTLLFIGSFILNG